MLNHSRREKSRFGRKQITLDRSGKLMADHIMSELFIIED
jgi:hypothetical protein